MYYWLDYTGRTVKSIKHTLMLGGPAHLTVNREERSTNIIRYMEPISIRDFGSIFSTEDDITECPECHTYNVMTFRINGRISYFPNISNEGYSDLPDEFEINVAIHESISNAMYPTNDVMSNMRRFQHEITRRIYYNSQYQVFYFDNIFNDSRNDAFDNPRDVINDFVRNKSKEVYRKRKKTIIKLDDNLFIL
ncbi:MAG: hypothetical protein ACOCQD_04375 [archaeon]